MTNDNTLLEYLQVPPTMSVKRMSGRYLFSLSALCAIKIKHILVKSLFSMIFKDILESNYLLQKI